MKVGVLGAGLMGKEAARDLAGSPGVTQVVLADVDLEKANQVSATLKSDKLTAERVDAKNQDELEAFIRRFDVIINALFYTFNETVAATAIKLGVNACDLGGHIGGATDHILKLQDEALKNQMTLIPDLGVAPGMINILSGYGVSKLDEAETILIRVGGIPVQPEPPFGYNHVFSMEGVFDHYTDPSFVIRNGEAKSIPSLSEIETIYFEKFGPLEAFHTAGGTSTIGHSFPYLKNLEYKTIRYPGHAEKFKLLVDLNLTQRDYTVEVNGQTIKPRDVLLKVLDPIVDLKDKEDVVLLRVIVSGTKDGQPKTYTYEMVTYKDTVHNVTAMARSTAYTISVVAQMLGNGTITQKGIFTPERIVPGKLYIEEMAKRGVLIKETVLDQKTEPI
ncbi:saccharopine dehydrogenase C-terminal domain-containing protein [Pullulanibacillus sp. KACC 23026]|uniref:saccharopine dehydrogenase family protein n=1 Tax=Pullulanibacillus sp. KACC 23026 TaxID=3028315 RepID=UPI0023B0DB81|nr:saccharopine dehydrogenase C-terminal domain-containing protein [Pullulanibacillus sp. KACC 23026]WEG14399.1 saccharopine dehydrogenase C-terminal domain-containing protein [Pullulanibacillus sp. KACC 23026]